MVGTLCRTVLTLGLAWAGWSVAVSGWASLPADEDAVFRTAYHDYRLVTIADGLAQPWSIEFLPEGDLLVTERPGRLRIIRNGMVLPPVEGVPPVRTQNLGGLLEVRLHPDFASNRLNYLSYSKVLSEDQGTTALLRARLEDNKLVDIQQIFQSVSEGLGHYGGRIVFDSQGYLYMTLGDRQTPSEGDLEKHPAQDLSNHHGVVIRLHDDGRVPEDNPFVGRADARPEIWTYGHRSPQGLAIHPETGEFWLTEHGPQGGDELNRLAPGANYGWPVVGFGVNYRSGLAIHSGTQREGMEQPVHVWVPSIATSGLMIYSGDRFPHWRGSFFAGGLAGQRIERLTLSDNRVVNREIVLQDVGRIRDIRQGPEGLIYVAIEDRLGETPIVRMEPVERGPLN